MLRNVFSGLVVAAIMAALYALGMYFGPLNWKLGDDAFDLLVFEEYARARALQLNAYALARVDGIAATDTALVASETSNVIQFPARDGSISGAQRSRSCKARPNASPG